MSTQPTSPRSRRSSGTNGSQCGLPLSVTLERGVHRIEDGLCTGLTAFPQVGVPPEYSVLVTPQRLTRFTLRRQIGCDGAS